MKTDNLLYNLLILFNLLLFSFSTANAGEVILEWDPVDDYRLTGYLVYVGQASGQYGDPIDCRVDELLDHYKPEVTITNLKSGATYYFSVKAYGEDKGEYIESDYSNEIHISMPIPLPGTSCGEGLVYDCVGNCVDQAKAWSWIGDWYCDDGTWGMDLRCDAFDAMHFTKFLKVLIPAVSFSYQQFLFFKLIATQRQIRGMSMGRMVQIQLSALPWRTVG